MIQHQTSHKTGYTSNLTKTGSDSTWYIVCYLASAASVGLHLDHPLAPSTRATSLIVSRPVRQYHSDYSFW